jgi:hypothetical protein
MTMSARPGFGADVMVAARLVRKNEYKGPAAGFHAVWRRSVFPEPVKALYLGWRSLSDGKLVNDYEDHNHFEATDTFNAYLVVTGERSAPFYVLPEDIQ